MPVLSLTRVELEIVRQEVAGRLIRLDDDLARAQANGDKDAVTRLGDERWLVERFMRKLERKRERNPEAYKAVLFAPDGDWVAAHRGKQTIEQVWEAVDEQGSSWVFFPFPTVVYDRGPRTTVLQKILDTPPELAMLKGKTISAATRYLAEHGDELAKALL